MTREEAERYRKVCRALDALRDERKKRPKTADVVKGSSAEFPYTEQRIKVEGQEPNPRADRKENVLIREKKRERERLEKKILAVDDPEIQSFLWLRYRDGLTVDEVAERAGYATETVSRKLSAFFEKSVMENHAER